MNTMQILKKVDFTILRPGTTMQQVLVGAAKAKQYGCAAFCLAPDYVAAVREQYPELRLATVVGFPWGYNTTGCKVFEAAQAIRNGADEIDMVINPDDVKSGRFHRVQAELTAMRDTCGDKLLKVIIETCNLCEEEKRRLAELVELSGADYIKTSTGFASAGAQIEDVYLLHEILGDRVRIKAAGGIRTLEQMQAFIAAGADRIGSSADPALLCADTEVQPGQ